MTKKSSRQPKTDLKDLSFEEALARLDETVQAMEAGGLALAEATRLFEVGMRLARLCSEQLAAAELKISRIQTAYGGQMRFLGEDQAEAEEEPC